MLVSHYKSRLRGTIMNTSSDSTVVVSDEVSPSGRLCYVLELGSAPLWEYLLCEDVANLIQMFHVELSQELVEGLAMKVIEEFVGTRMIHLGSTCGCDWMRKLNFFSRSGDVCNNMGMPYFVDTTLPVFQFPDGARRFLHALVLTEQLEQILGRHNWANFVPVVYPLMMKDEQSLIPCTEEAVRLAMNRIHHNAGDRFFYKFKSKRGRALLEFLDHHWDNIEDSSCQYCDSVIQSQESLSEKAKLFIQENCRSVYRPLKTLMMKDLQFVRYVRRPRALADFDQSYEGLIAGITRGGILCGFYLVEHFWEEHAF